MRIHYFQFLPCLPQPSPHWTQGRTSLASLKLTCLRFMVNAEEKVDIDYWYSEQLTHLHRPKCRIFCAKSRWIQHNDSAHLVVVNLDFSFTKRFSYHVCLQYVFVCFAYHGPKVLEGARQRPLSYYHVICLILGIFWYCIWLFDMFAIMFRDIVKTCVWPSTKTAFM